METYNGKLNLHGSCLEYLCDKIDNVELAFKGLNSISETLYERMREMRDVHAKARCWKYLKGIHKLCTRLAVKYTHFESRPNPCANDTDEEQKMTIKEITSMCGHLYHAARYNPRDTIKPLCMNMILRLVKHKLTKMQEFVVLISFFKPNSYDKYIKEYREQSASREEQDN